MGAWSHRIARPPSVSILGGERQDVRLCGTDPVPSPGYLMRGDLPTGAIRIPGLKPIREPNVCSLEPFKPETPKTTLYVVSNRLGCPLQVV
jgi:hypothetical protein